MSDQTDKIYIAIDNLENLLEDIDLLPVSSQERIRERIDELLLFYFFVRHLST